MLRKVWFRARPWTSNIWLVLLGALIATPSWAAPSGVSVRSAVFCELAALPVLPLASDSAERFTPEELLNRVAESYRGLLEFAGDEFSATRLASLLVVAPSLPLENFFAPVPVAEQRSVALNESLTKLGDWVLLDAEEHGLTQSIILTRLRETVWAHMERVSQEQERVDGTREDQRDPGVETSTGAIFYRDTSRPELGEAFRDPDGMIWGDTVKNLGGSIREMRPAEALEYCRSIGAELPSKEDFIRLREYMGAELGGPDNQRSPGYRAQILPGLNSGIFWSSLVHPDYSNYAYYFYGDDGCIDYVTIYGSVRCVARTGVAR